MARGVGGLSINRLLMTFLFTALSVAIIFRVNAIEKIVTGKAT